MYSETGGGALESDPGVANSADAKAAMGRASEKSKTGEAAL
jgi:hypothetical protein